MNWFADKLGPLPGSPKAAANGAARPAQQNGRSAPQPAPKAAQPQRNAPQQKAAPAPAPEPDKKKKKGWF